MAQIADNTRIYRGQGQALMARRTPFGKPQGFQFVGNVSELKINPKTESIKHIESQTGNNSVDAKIEKNLEVEITYNTCSNYKSNLVRLLFGKLTEIAAGTITDEEIIAYLGKASILDNINLASFSSLTDEAGAVTYVRDTDYFVDLPTGTIEHAPGASYAEGAILKANYTTNGEEAIAAFEGINENFWLRFNGLNTAENNAPVVIDIPNMRLDPVKELAAINNDDFNKYEQTGIALFDRYRDATSKYSRYFTVRQVPVSV